MGRQGQPSAPAALPCGNVGQVGQAADPGAVFKVVGQDQFYQYSHLNANGKHHQCAQSAG